MSTPATICEHKRRGRRFFWSQAVFAVFSLTIVVLRHTAYADSPAAHIVELCRVASSLATLWFLVSWISGPSNTETTNGITTDKRET